MSLSTAILASIQAAVPGVAVFDGIVPDEPPDRYVVVYVDDGTVAALAVCARSDSATCRWQTTCVAPDREMAGWLATRIRDATVDSAPVAAGWVCGQVCHQFSERPSRDETVQEKPVVFKIDLYDLLATRT